MAIKINFIAVETLETLIPLILDDESRHRKLDYADASRTLSSFRALFSCVCSESEAIKSVSMEYLNW